MTLAESRMRLSPHTLPSGSRGWRGLWSVVWAILGRPSPTPAHAWRRALVRAFGGEVGAGVHIYPSAVIWAPWNLRMADRSCLANGSVCYNVAQVMLGHDVVISQDAYLCTATHDYNDAAFPLMAAPIHVEARAWVAAGAFISPGVTVHCGAVVGARAVVTRDVEAWTVAAGNPARTVKLRTNLDEV